MAHSRDSQISVSELVARARRLQVKARHLALSQFAGLYRSAFRGQGMEFAEVREYAAGDDIRLIDWNVSARSPSLYVKRMAEERERNVLIAIDTSASLRFGTRLRTKFELVQEVAALLALACAYGKDRVSLVLFGGRIEAFIPAAKGWTHTERIVRDIASAQPAPQAEASEAIWHFLNSAPVPRSLLFLFTDFLGPLRPGNTFSAACRKHQPIAFVVSDPREWELPSVGRLRVRDPETGRLGLIHTGRRSEREAYSERAQQVRAGVHRTLKSAGIDFLELDAGADYEIALRRFLESRIAKTGYRRP
jgi:uncharacterized protein (DUF58 family)